MFCQNLFVKSLCAGRLITKTPRNRSMYVQSIPGAPINAHVAQIVEHLLNRRKCWVNTSRVHHYAVIAQKGEQLGCKADEVRGASTLHCTIFVLSPYSLNCKDIALTSVRCKDNGSIPFAGTFYC